MPAVRVLIAQFTAAALLAVAMWIVVSNALYWRFPWVDVPMHVLGGVWAGLCASWILARNGASAPLAWCFAFALALGIAWELFEYSEGIVMSRHLSYTADTAKDIAMDLAGAALGWLFARKLVL